jgi:hypothetical protein
MKINEKQKITTMQEAQRSDEIDEMLKREALRSLRLKVILIGNRKSGMGTYYTHVKSLSGGGREGGEERALQAEKIRRYTVKCAQALVKGMSELGVLEYSSEEDRKSVRAILSSTYEFHTNIQDLESGLTDTFTAHANSNAYEYDMCTFPSPLRSLLQYLPSMTDHSPCKALAPALPRLA